MLNAKYDMAYEPIGVVAYASDAAFRSSTEQADVTRQVVDTTNSMTNSMFSALKDAESGQRGFLLTGAVRVWHSNARPLLIP